MLVMLIHVGKIGRFMPLLLSSSLLLLLSSLLLLLLLSLFVAKALFSLWLWPLLQIKLGRIILLLYILKYVHGSFSAFMTSWWLSWKTFL